jgi:hypothetical protein
MGITLVVGIVSGIMLTQSQNVSKQTLVPRVKSSMAKVEQRLSEAVLTPEAFTCTGSGVATCTLNSDYLLQFSLPVGGTDCANPPCRAVIDPATLVMDAAAKKVRASIVYEGDSIPIRPINFEVDIPSEILQLATTRCPASSPLFRGFDASGRVKCDPLPASCGNDQFLTSVERSTLIPNCNLIPEAAYWNDYKAQLFPVEMALTGKYVVSTGFADWLNNRLSGRSTNFSCVPGYCCDNTRDTCSLMSEGFTFSINLVANYEPELSTTFISLGGTVQGDFNSKGFFCQ